MSGRRFFAVSAGCFVVATSCAESLDGLTRAIDPPAAPDSSMTAASCEESVAESIDHCGACGNACPWRPNSTPQCADGGCTTVCNPGFAACSGDQAAGCSTDLATDPAHCGRCGYDCGGGACVGGLCRSLTIATPPQSIQSFTVQDDRILFSTGREYLPDGGGGARLRACATTGCKSAPELVDAVSNASSRALQADDLGEYWWAGNRVRFLSRDGGTMRDIADVPLTLSSPQLLASAGDDVYIASYDRINRASKSTTDGGPASSWQMTNPTVITSDGIHVYWGTSNAILRCASGPSCASVENVGATTGSVTSILVDSANVYWSTTGPTGVVGACPKTGCTGLTILGERQRYPRSLVADATYVYWLLSESSLSAASIVRAPKGGLAPNQAPEIVHHPPTSASLLAVDANYLYWSEGSSLQRLRKP